MRGLALLLLLVACGSSTPSQSAPETEVAAGEVAKEPAAEPEQAGLLKTATFPSDSLGVDKSYLVYLPAGYEGNETRYPVVYMLHGLGGDEDNWSKMGLVTAADKLKLQAIVVMMDGDDSFYANSQTPADYQKCLGQPRTFGRASSLETYCVKHANYETYVATDMVAHVDSTYRTIAKREARAIGGLSMGGFGALMIGMRHKDVFSSVASHSGVTALLYKGPFPFETGKTQLIEDPMTVTKNFGRIGTLLYSIFGTDIQNWRDHDPAFLAKSLNDGELAIYLDCGTEDEFRLHNGVSYLHEVLESRGIAHDFTLAPGTHSASFWADRIDDSLAFHTKHFATP